MEDLSRPTSGPDTVLVALKNIRELDSHLLKPIFDQLIPANLAPVPSFWSSYSEAEVYIGLRACLLIWIVTGYKVVPRKFQLQATIASITGKDCLVDVGTGYGKTLCMALPCLLAPKDLAIIFSPLKRLQAVHVQALTGFRIDAVSINEDTPNSPELWKEIQEGKFTALVVQPEQLFMIDGHLPRLARLLQDRTFSKLVKRICVDEAHFIYSSGTALYGQPAFRGAWGRLGEFRIKLGKLVPLQALSGTQPPHIKKAIIKNLLFDEEHLLSIKLTSNRPNIIYATHPIAGEISDFRNLDFLIQENCPLDVCLPKAIIFHDDREECANAAFYLDRRLHPSLWDTGIIRHYHGTMSTEYLTEIYEDFCTPDSKCCILHATSGASTGLDIPDIDIVVQYGICRDVPSTLQRGGRGGRNSTDRAIFLIMYEPWVLEIDLSSSTEDPSDPDFPNEKTQTKFSTKRQRTGRAMISVIQSKNMCIRKFFAQYLDDQSTEALTFTFGYCCERHPETDFHLRDFFQGQFLYQDGSRLFYGAEDDLQRREILPPRNNKRPSSQKTRKPNERAELKSRLYVWREDALKTDELSSVRPVSFILDDNSIKVLATLHPTNIINTAQLVLAINETTEWEEEWSKKILNVIHSYDQELEQNRKTSINKKKSNDKKRRMELDLAGFQAESERLRISTELRFRASAAQGSSRFANTRN